MPISAPLPDGDILGPAEVLGHLLLICPVEFMQEVATKFDKKDKPSPDAIRVDVAVLTQTDDQGQVPVYRGALWFNVMLAKSLRRQLGDTVLARMAQGRGTPGQNPPFVLEDATNDPQALAFAQQWLDAHPEFEAVAQRTYQQLNAGASAVSAPAQAAATTTTQPRPAAVAIPGGVTNAQVPLPGQPQVAHAGVAQAVGAAVPVAAATSVPAPEGIDPALWAIMTEEQKQTVLQFKG